METDSFYLMTLERLLCGVIILMAAMSSSYMAAGRIKPLAEEKVWRSCRNEALENSSRDVHTLGMVGGQPAKITPLPSSGYRFGRYFRTVATAWSTPATAPRSAMICLTVSLRGLPMWTLPEAQTLLEEPYGPEGRRAATGSAQPVWQSNQHRHNRDEGHYRIAL